MMKYAKQAAAAVVEWTDVQRPEVSVVARVRPADTASQRVVVHAGLRRADQLDTQEEDDLNWIYERRWP